MFCDDFTEFNARYLAGRSIVTRRGVETLSRNGVCTDELVPRMRMRLRQYVAAAMGTFATAECSVQPTLMMRHQYNHMVCVPSHSLQFPKY